MQSRKNMFFRGHIYARIYCALYVPNLSELPQWTRATHEKCVSCLSEPEHVRPFNNYLRFDYKNGHNFGSSNHFLMKISGYLNGGQKMMPVKFQDDRGRFKDFVRYAQFWNTSKTAHSQLSETNEIPFTRHDKHILKVSSKNIYQNWSYEQFQILQDFHITVPIFRMF